MVQNEFFVSLFIVEIRRLDSQLDHLNHYMDKVEERIKAHNEKLMDTLKHQREEREKRRRSFHEVGLFIYILKKTKVVRTVCVFDDRWDSAGLSINNFISSYYMCIYSEYNLLGYISSLIFLGQVSHK